MCKKAITTGLGIVLASGLLFGTGAWSYVKTACNRVGQAAEDSVPIDFQIDRARQMVADLAPEVRESMHVIAKEEIALENLNKQIAGAEEKAEKSKGEILRLQSDLSDGRTVFRYAGHSYSRDEVTEDLSRRFSRFKVTDETLDHLKSMRDARSKNLDAARKKLTAMISAQKKLETDIANLEAKRKLVEVAQASSEVIFDDSQLAQAKELITDIRTKLDVAAKLANADVNVQAEIPLDAEESADVTEQVAAYFELNTPRLDVKVATASLSQE
ncbi:MAG: hypothetical protein AAGJ46_11515 [Planctomycetota bacterium]